MENLKAYENNYILSLIKDMIDNSTKKKIVDEIIYPFINTLIIKYLPYLILIMTCFIIIIILQIITIVFFYCKK
jgi:hypothetical protein